MKKSYDYKKGKNHNDGSVSRKSKSSYRNIPNFDAKFGKLSSKRSRISPSQSPRQVFKKGKMKFGRKSSRSRSRKQNMYLKRTVKNEQRENEEKFDF
jgi:hypothetical protein